MGLVERLGRPEVGVVLGSGFGTLAEAWRAGPAVVLGGRTELLAAEIGHGLLWVVRGRRHLYEGYRADEVALPIEAVAGAMRWLTSGVEAMVASARGGILTGS